MIFGVGFFALGLALAVSIKSLAETSKNNDNKKGNETFYLSEAAMREGYYQYKNNPSPDSYSPTPEPFPDSNASVEILINNDWPYKEIIGIAERNAAHGETSHRENVYKIVSGGAAFNCAAYSSYVINLNGNAQIIGNVYAGDEINDPRGNISGGSKLTSSDVIIPAPIIDIDPYISESPMAYTASQAGNGIEDGTINNSVVYVNDTHETKINGGPHSINFTGSLVTVGDLRLNSGTFTALGEHVAIYVEGDLYLEGGVEINGIVYVKGNTKITGNGNKITGSLISVGAIETTDLLGTITIDFDENLSEVWSDLTGLNTTSPVIDSWEER